MIKFIRQWMLQRAVKSVCGACYFWLKSSDVSNDLVRESYFYDAKKLFRERFPGAFIEIAEGVVTVVKDGLTAKVRV